MRNQLLMLALGLVALLPVKAQELGQAQQGQGPQGQDDTGVQFLVGLGIQSVDNIFAATSNPVSDLITTTSVGVTANAGYSRQHLLLNARLDDSHYHSHSNMSFQGSNISGMWQWESGAGWFGSARLGRVVAQNVSAINVDATQRNLNTTRDSQVIVGYNFTGGWQAVSGVVDVVVRNERAVLGQTDYSYSGAYAGGSYAFQSGSTLGVQTLVASGFNLYNYRLVSNQIKLEVKADEAVILTGAYAYMRQNYETRPEYDFSGQIGNGSMKWQFTDKTSLTTSFQRQLNAVPFANSIYTINDTLMLAPSWQITSKVVLKGDLQNTEIRFQGDPGGGASGEVDHFTTRAVSLEWMPRDRSTVVLNIGRTNRTRNLDASNARVNRVALTAGMQF